MKLRLPDYERVSETAARCSHASAGRLVRSEFSAWFITDTGPRPGRFVPRQIGSYNFAKPPSLASADGGIQALNAARVSRSWLPAR
jgi:hypothetical protein